jgi:hypothetical protein
MTTNLNTYFEAFLIARLSENNVADKDKERPRTETRISLIK